MIRAVLFDLDGTLVNSLPEIAHGVNRALVLQGHAPLPQDRIASMIGRGVSVLADRVTRAAGPDSIDRDQLFQDIVSTWAETNGRETKLFPDARDVLARLRDRNLFVGLVTNKLRALTLQFLEDQSLSALFDVIVAGDDCPNPKPAPDMIERALAELQVAPDEAVMVGDSRNDALAARSAGVRAVLLTTGYNEGLSMEDWARDEGFDQPFASLSLAFASMTGDKT